MTLRIFVNFGNSAILPRGFEVYGTSRSKVMKFRPKSKMSAGSHLGFLFLSILVILAYSIRWSLPFAKHEVSSSRRSKVSTLKQKSMTAAGGHLGFCSSVYFGNSALFTSWTWSAWPDAFKSYDLKTEIQDGGERPTWILILSVLVTPIIPFVDLKCTSWAGQKLWP